MPQNYQQVRVQGVGVEEGGLPLQGQLQQLKMTGQLQVKIVVEGEEGEEVG